MNCVGAAVDPSFSGQIPGSPQHQASLVASAPYLTRPGSSSTRQKGLGGAAGAGNLGWRSGVGQATSASSAALGGDVGSGGFLASMQAVLGGTATGSGAATLDSGTSEPLLDDAFFSMIQVWPGCGFKLHVCLAAYVCGTDLAI